MRLRLAMLLLAAGLAAGCASTQRRDQIQALSSESRELFAKYRQFMTEGQQDQFLALASQQEQQAFVESLKVEERLARYPPEIQEAIWRQDVIPGMDNAAVLLTWGSPSHRAFDDVEHSKGNDVQRWQYQRGAGGELVNVVITNGVVTALERTGR